MSPASPESRAPSPVFALVAGEDSGDQLGADLVEALRARFPDAAFVGIGGPRMRAVGFESWHDIAELSVMGVAEVLRDLPRLLRLRAALARRLEASPPDVFIGIDAPDFNLGLERRLKRAGIRTAHYVSPSVWAWRQQRAAKIGQSADLVLCLFPMEPAIYAKYGVAAQFVGHPLADRFPLASDRDAARRELGLAPAAPVLAVLPGSRGSEIQRLGTIFLDAARRIADATHGLQIVIPAANARCRKAIEGLLHESGLGTRDSGLDTRDSGLGTRDSGFGTRDPGLENTASTSNAAATDNAGSGSTPSNTPAPSPGSRIPNPLLLDGQAHRAMAAADVVLLASGTAALEAMLAKRPMVVGYRIAPTTHALVKGLGMLKTDLYSLPNVLAGRQLVPELMQRDCTADKLAAAVLDFLHSPARCRELVEEFERMHLALHAGGGAAATAARAIAGLVDAPHATADGVA